MIAVFALVAAGLAAHDDDLARAIARAADDDARFEVLSEVEVRDAVELEAQRQSCGSDAPSCAAQLAGALDARFVLFVRRYDVGDVSHLAFTLTDLSTAQVKARSDLDGDEAGLYRALEREVPRLLSSVDGAGPFRLFVSSVDSADDEVAHGNTGFVIGGAALGIGGIGAVVGGAIALVDAARIIGDADSSGDAKSVASVEQTGGFVLVGVGVGAVIAGAVLVGVGLE